MGPAGRPKVRGREEEGRYLRCGFWLQLFLCLQAEAVQREMSLASALEAG